MATPAAIWSALVLLLVVFTASGASEATFYVNNRCPYTVYPAEITTCGCTVLKPGETWAFTVPAGVPGRIWARNDCAFDPVTGHGGCHTGDCRGALRCVLPRKPPATLAEFAIAPYVGAPDSYGISVVDGFNTPLDFTCGAGGDADSVIRCRDPACPDANHHPGDGKNRACLGYGYYEVVFCPTT
ncbi:unnamed protein product [Alopecurus aequalis]